MKKFLSIVLTIAMILSTVSVVAFADGEVSVWNGVSYDTDWFTNAEPETKEFTIETAAQFAGIAKLVNEGTTKFSGMTVKLATDIDLAKKDWTPIGSDENDRSFRGSFDGQGHTISNLRVSAADDFLGLFGYAGVDGDQGDVYYKDFTLNNAYVVSTVTNNDGGSYVGGVFGNSRVSRIENVDLTGEITIQGYGYVGGITGHGYPNAKNCDVTAEGSIISHYWCGGGIAGYAGEDSSRFTKCTVTATGEGLKIFGNYGGVGSIAGLVQTDNDPKSVIVSDCFAEGVVIEANSNYCVGYIAGNGNEDEDGDGNNLVNNSFAKDVSATVSGNVFVPEDVPQLVAMVDGVPYGSLQAAIEDAEDGATVTILAGTYNAFTIPADTNAITIAGETDSEGNNLVTVRTLEEDVDTHTKGIYVQAETVTIKNFDITAGTVTNSWMSASIGNDNQDHGPISSLKNLTVENVNFTGSGIAQAIWTNQGNVTVKNCTITNYVKGVDTEAIGANQKMTIENTVIDDVEYAFHTGAAIDGAEIIVTGSEIDTDKIDIGGTLDVNISNSKIENATATAFGSSSITISESELYNTNVAAATATAFVTLNNVYANNVNSLAAAADANANISFNTYYPTYEEFEAKTGAVAVPAVADAIEVKFVETTSAEGEKLYNINLVATNNEVINRLNSVDLTFALNQDNGTNDYEIIASNEEVVINNVDNSKDRYEFHYKGKDGVKTDCGNTITIGQVKFKGYGQFDFAVNANVDTNVAHTTTIGDNIVDTYIPNTDETTVAKGELLINNNLNDVVIKVPTRALTINIDFPNAVNANGYDYQQMKVTVTGDDIETIEYKLGDTVAMNNGDYKIVVEDKLTLNNAYTVEVSGEGYRTARYTVTMTDKKELNFWNNVKDAAIEVEEGKASSAKTVTFLAGDIVKDSNINIYDLSAVVSYFGTVKIADKADAIKYIKYDLNRDGKIDSKDVAYVLVSWGK